MFLYFIILSSIVSFNQIEGQTYSVLQFGAVGDGNTNDTKAVRDTLTAAANSNGGRVIFDEGYTFLTGCFNVTSNVILDVKGKILASNNTCDFVPVQPLPWLGGGQDAEQSGQMEWQSVVRSYNAQNITLTGGGIIDGQGEVWWHSKVQHCPATEKLGLSRPQLVRFINTVDITIYNITLKDSPAWTLHLANTTNVHANYVTITAATNGSNTDGFDIDCSVNVTVENSYYEGGDDAVAVKSGINWLGRTFGRTSENILVRNLTIGRSGGMSIGSEMSAGVRNVTYRDIVMNNSRNGAFIKTLRGRGGIIEDITYTNIRLYNIDNGIQFSMNTNNPPTNDTATPKIRNININNFYAEGVNRAWYLYGLPESVINNTVFYNITMKNANSLIRGCNYTYGSCDNATVFPYCPPCIIDATTYSTTTNTLTSVSLPINASMTISNGNNGGSYVENAFIRNFIYIFISYTFIYFLLLE